MCRGFMYGGSCHSKEEAENARQTVFTDHGTRTTVSDIVELAA